MINMDMPELPEGYEYTGEFRKAELGELFASIQRTTQVFKARPGTTTHPRAIVKKVRVHPSVGDEYFYLRNLNSYCEPAVKHAIYDGSSKDIDRFEKCNYFISRADAVETLDGVMEYLRERPI